MTAPEFFDPDDGAIDGDHAPAPASLHLRRDEARPWLDAVFGDRPGYIALAFGSAPYRDASGGYRHRQWRERRYSWPVRRERMLHDVAELLAAADAGGAQVDVYLCPHARSSDARVGERNDKRDGNALAPMALHADIDGPPADPDLLAELDPLRVQSGSAGHEHATVALAEPCEDINRWYQLQRALRDRLGGGADAKIADNDVLRLPGTVNAKPTAPRRGEASAPPAPVAPIPGWGGRRWRVAELAELLGVDLSAPAPVVKPQRSTDLPPPAAVPVPDPLADRVADALDDLAHAAASGGDKSPIWQAIIWAAAAAGYSREQTYAIASDRALPYIPRYEKRLAYQFDKSWVSGVAARDTWQEKQHGATSDDLRALAVEEGLDAAQVWAHLVYELDGNESAAGRSWTGLRAVVVLDSVHGPASTDAALTAAGVRIPGPPRTRSRRPSVTLAAVQKALDDGATASELRAMSDSQVVPADRDAVAALLDQHAAADAADGVPDIVLARREVPQSGRAPAVLLEELLADLRTWQYLPDATPLLAALAVAVTADEGEGDPPWLLLVAPPSSGKTELVRVFALVAAATLDDVTVGGLLSWTNGKLPVRRGLLTRVTRGLITLGDLSTLLAGSDHGGRDEVFGLLRRVADGELTREVAPRGGGDHVGALHWEGRVQAIAAVTGVIDRYANHNAELGDRWLSCRLRELTRAETRKATRLCRTRDLPGHRAQTAKLVAELVTSAREQLDDDELSTALADAIEDAALVTTLGRAAVPRAKTGRREVEDMPVVEAPMRLVRQLSAVAIGLRALGLDDDRTAAVCRRLALDSMPSARLEVLRALTGVEAPMSTAQVARVAGLHWNVASRRLEELAAIGVVDALTVGDDGVELPDVVVGETDVPVLDRRVSCRWTLADDEKDLLSGVMAAPSCADISHRSGVSYPVITDRCHTEPGGHPHHHH